MLPSITSRWPSDKESTCKARNTADAGSIPGLENPLEEDGNPLQENPMDRGAWQTAVQRITQELNMTEAAKQQQRVVNN